MIEELSNILKRIAERPDLTIRRSVKPYDIKDCLSVVWAIGDSTIGGFRFDKDNSAVYEKFVAWVLNLADCGLERQKGIYLAGPVGTGKSVCMAVMRDFAKEVGAMVKVADKTDFLAWKSWRTDEVCAQYAATGDLSPYKEARVACFEDLGSEPMETLYMGNRVNVMREIIEYRGDQQGLITHFTSNIPIDRLAAVGTNVRYGQRVQSRIMQMCNYLVLGGADRRNNTFNSL